MSEHAKNEHILLHNNNSFWIQFYIRPFFCDKPWARINQLPAPVIAKTVIQFSYGIKHFIVSLLSMQLKIDITKNTLRKNQATDVSSSLPYHKLRSSRKKIRNYYHQKYYQHQYSRLLSLLNQYLSREVEKSSKDSSRMIVTRTSSTSIVSMKQSQSEEISSAKITTSEDEEARNDGMTTLNNIKNKDNNRLFVFKPFETDE